MCHSHRLVRVCLPLCLGAMLAASGLRAAGSAELQSDVNYEELNASGDNPEGARVLVDLVWKF